ncbi:hypothetical protein Ahy_A04g019962 isoform A [Arachis hypogaea]|uniref:Chloride channel protein n=1 Tax=Arachis hypogaea TaxID=3818 RepID=A0A445DGX0_ARAHY|nr:hypothetical protein Ahy_A04g019962 isoform A [Arachis hypogaea]
MWSKDHWWRFWWTVCVIGRNCLKSGEQIIEISNYRPSSSLKIKLLICCNKPPIPDCCRPRLAIRPPSGVGQREPTLGFKIYKLECKVTDSAAAGSGIPEIKGYLNGDLDFSTVSGVIGLKFCPACAKILRVDIGFLLLRTLIGKIFGSIGSVGGGLALGKEGPLVHTGACIASLLGQVLRSARDRRDLVTCGCAAGVAAAFRAPVGGVLWRNQLMWRVFFTSAIVAVVVRTAMGWCKNGNCGYFGSGRFIIWDIYQSKDLCFYLFHCQLSIKVLFLSSSLDWFYF